jgi:tetratricopeptide (TPR) repeat protein
MNIMPRRILLLFSGLLVLLVAAPAAHAQALQALAAEHRAWQRDFDAAYERDDEAASVRALAKIARWWPAGLGNYEDRDILIVISWGGETPAAPAARFDLLCALFDAEWQFTSSVEPASAWDRLVRMHVDRGDWASAGEVLQKLRSPGPVLRMRIDKRFDRLVRAYPERFDVKTVALEQLRDWQAAMRRQPRSAYTTYDTIVAHLQLGNYYEALRLADNTLARSRKAGSPEAAYDDVSEAYHYIYVGRSEALLGLGNWKAAETEMKSTMIENGDVDGRIDLAGLYSALDRADEAIATLAKLTQADAPLSPFGRMAVQSVLHEAALVKGDKTLARQALDKLRRNRNDAVWLLFQQLLRAGELDEAATLLVELLEQKSTRSRALAEMQEYLPVPLPPGDIIVERARERLLQRNEVRTAILKVGRLERFEIPRL